MSTNSTFPSPLRTTPIYIGVGIAICVLAMAAIVLGRIRRARTRRAVLQPAFVAPPQFPPMANTLPPPFQRQSFNQTPRPPPNSFPSNPRFSPRWNAQPSWQSPPSHPPPRQGPAPSFPIPQLSPRSPNERSFLPTSPGPVSPTPGRNSSNPLRSPSSTSPDGATPPARQTNTSNLDGVETPPNPVPDQTSLLERMREVQTTMLEITRLQAETSVDNRERIERLQERVTELTNVDAASGQAPAPTHVVHSSGANIPPDDILEPPPAYRDGRDD